MSKKTFSGGLNSLLGEPSERPKAGKPEEAVRKPLGGSENIRTTLIIPGETMERLKAIAYWDRKLIKDLVYEALEVLISSYEIKKGSEYPPIPK